MEWDIFISHAYEDKVVVARPLADMLAAVGLTVWLDEAELFVGDSLRSKIDAGLNHSRFGVVILSPNFFSKEWPKSELDGLIARESHGDKVILPVWHNVTVSEVRAYSPILAGRLGVSTEKGLAEVSKKILQAVRAVGRSGVRGRPIYKGHLTKKVLFNLPIGSVLMSNTVNPDLTPEFVEEVGTFESREALWNRLRLENSTGRKWYVFADTANLRAHLAARHLWLTEW
ncbi:MAG TPA: toll/interleukin-1 receptor domain-containing protein [Nitrososphaera sp.]|nr:toll/interleukin-1 receptor domain-containing protein [Nitrososphaera sp.]